MREWFLPDGSVNPDKLGARAWYDRGRREKRVGRASSEQWITNNVGADAAVAYANGYDVAAAPRNVAFENAVSSLRMARPCSSATVASPRRARPGRAPRVASRRRTRTSARGPDDPHPPARARRPPLTRSERSWLRAEIDRRRRAHLAARLEADKILFAGMA